MGHVMSTRGVFMSFMFGLPSLCVCDEEKSFCDSGSDFEYEGERKKALKMYHKIKKDNASNAESGVEQRRELHLKKNDKVRVRCICRGKVPQFGCEDGDDDSGSKAVVSSRSKRKGQSKEKGQVSGSKGKSNNKTKVGGGIRDKGEYFPWSLQCSKLPNEETWVVKTFKDTHKCLQSRIVKKCTASFLSKSVEESIKPNPKIPLNSLKDQLQKQYEVGISNQKAGKRDLLGLDECFLSGSYPGWILIVVGVDPNNGIYPLAYAIVESENKDSWK
nr:hypothetical protein [Tanacetum cinerariifolium]